MAGSPVIEVIKQRLQNDEAPTLEEAAELVALCQRLTSEREQDRALIMQAQLEQHNRQALVAAHGALIATHEAAVRDNAARTHAIVDAALDCIVVFDHTGRVVEWNPAAERTFGYRRDEACCRDVAELIIPPCLRDRHRRRLARYLLGGEGPWTGQRIETMALRADGSELPVELAITRLPVDGSPIFMGFLRDISDRKRACEAFAFLAQASKVLAPALDYETALAQVTHVAVPFLADCCAIDVLGPDACVRRRALAHRDPAKEALLRMLEEQSPLDQNRLAPVARVIATGQAEIIPEITRETIEDLAPDPEQRRVLRSLDFRSAMVVPLVARGQTLGTIFFAIAGSERRYTHDDLILAQDLAVHIAAAVDNARLYDEARQAVRDRDVFLGMAAHELKAPLATLISATGFLLRSVECGGEVDDRVRHVLSIASTSTLDLDRLLDALVTLARLKGTSGRRADHPVDLCMVVRGVIAAVEEPCEPAEPRPELRYVFPDEPLVIAAEERLIELAVRNLLENAVKYSPRGWPITVQLKAQGPDALLIVRDHGIGIPPAAQPHLFEPFYRAENVDERSRGMGIGLYLVNEVVTQHRGTIAVANTADGGAEFTVRLPRLEHK